MRALGLRAEEDSNGNVQDRTLGQHNAWHHLFGILMADEAIELILSGWGPESSEDKQGWYVLFGELTNKEVIEKIKNYWSLEYTAPKVWKDIVKLRENRDQTMTQRNTSAIRYLRMVA